MGEFKYTNDGKKVKVIGNLNSQEKIVQEIFIVDGQEVPSGENFVVKSLHDAPAVSWKEKELERIEKRYNEEYKEYQRKIKSLKAERDKKGEMLSKHLHYLRQAMDDIREEDLQYISDIISGKTEYILIKDFKPEILPFDDFFSSGEYGPRMKFLEIFATNKEGITLYTNSNKIVPCYTYEEAKEKLQEYINSKNNLNPFDVKTAKKYDLILDREKINEFKDRQIKNLNDQIKEYEEKINRAKQEKSKWENDKF